MKNASPVLTLLTLLITTTARGAEQPPVQLELVEVNKVWDRGAHNAFTDLVRFQGWWWMVFREASEHGVPPVHTPGGQIRVLRCSDGMNWRSAALLDYGEGHDLRDPKLSITPEGKLMLLCAAAPNASPNDRQSLVYLSHNGIEWGNAHKVADFNYWLWRVTWHKGIARGLGYRRDGANRHVRLYKSKDGLKFETLVGKLHDAGYPNEASLLFLDDDRALCLLRRDDERENSALLGTACPPYTEWAWKDLGKRIGGPAMIQLPNGAIITGTRFYEGGQRTALSWLDLEAGTLIELLTLPSGGDNSYPGLVWHNDLLWVSYYSSHEGKTSIYLAKVRVKETRE